MLGKVLAMQWMGDDLDLGIIDRLNDDESLKQPIIESRDVGISASAELPGWIVFTFSSTGHFSLPSRQAWDCYQAIAHNLLEMPIPGRTWRKREA